MLSTKANALIDQLITEMAMVLAFGHIDLHDERQVLRALVAAGFSAGDAITLSDQVIVTARAKSGTAPKKFTPCVWPIGACPHPQACECADREEARRNGAPQ